MASNHEQALKNAKVLKVIAYICLAISVGIALNGKVFINAYDISDSRTSMIEAALMQVAHLRYLSAAVFTLIGAIFFSTSQLLEAILLKNEG
jgi:hypothetical protein